MRRRLNLILLNIKSKLIHNYELSDSLIFSFGLFGIVNYPVFYYIWKCFGTEVYNDLKMRIFAALLCTFLLCKNFWPRVLKTYFYIYWYITVGYCLPFLGTYMFIANHASSEWVLNIILGLFWLILVLDWISFCIILPLGSILACIYYYFSNGTIYLNSENLFTTFINIIWVVVTALVFSRKRELALNKKELDRLSHIYKELEHALSAKTEFLNNMSHEIRTPIQGVKGTADGLVAHWTELNDDKKFEYANLISYSANRLHKLVGHLLDLTKFANNKMLLELKPVDLSDLVLDMIEECKLLYLHDKKIEIRFIEIKNTFISADAERISQVLRNLFTNAIKFSSNNSILHAKLSLSEITYDDGVKIDAIHFALQDQGIGIPADELASIFTAFVQSSITKTKAGGTGLGLSICREIIHAHHGKIWAESSDDGAIFNFVIPIIQDKQMDGHNIIAENDILFEENIITGNATILIIDDEDVCLSGMELILFGTNYRLIKHNTGHAGIDYLRTNKVDLILLDLMMPDMYGLNVLAEIKADEKLTDIPVILQTGTSDEAEINKAYSGGIFSYIKKPYNKNIILSTIARAVNARVVGIKEKEEL